MSRRDGVYRAVYSVLLDHPDYHRLTSRARHVLLTIRLSEECGVACLFRCRPEVFAERTGYSVGEIEAALEELTRTPSARHPWIVWHQGWVWVRNGLKHDPGRPLTDSKRLQGVCRVVAGCPHAVLRWRFLKHYGIQMDRQGAYQGATKGLVPPNPIPNPNPESRYQNPKPETSASNVLTASSNGNHGSDLTAAEVDEYIRKHGGSRGGAVMALMRQREGR